MQVYWYNDSQLADVQQKKILISNIYYKFLIRGSNNKKLRKLLDNYNFFVNILVTKENILLKNKLLNLGNSLQGESLYLKNYFKVPLYFIIFRRKQSRKISFYKLLKYLVKFKYFPKLRRFIVLKILKGSILINIYGLFFLQSKKKRKKTYILRKFISLI